MWSRISPLPVNCSRHLRRLDRWSRSVQGGHRVDRLFIARAGLRKYQSRRQSRREQLLAEEQATA